MPSGYQSPSTWCFLSKCWSRSSFVQLSYRLLKNTSIMSKKTESLLRTHTRTRSTAPGTNKAARWNLFVLVRGCEIIYMWEQLSVLFWPSWRSAKNRNSANSSGRESGVGKKGPWTSGSAFCQRRVSEPPPPPLPGSFLFKKILPSLTSSLLSVNIQTELFP